MISRGVRLWSRLSSGVFVPNQVEKTIRLLLWEVEEGANLLARRLRFKDHDKPRLTLAQVSRSGPAPLTHGKKTPKGSE